MIMRRKESTLRYRQTFIKIVLILLRSGHHPVFAASVSKESPV
jgi:hypothetical protein